MTRLWGFSAVTRSPEESRLRLGVINLQKVCSVTAKKPGIIGTVAND